MPLDAPLTNGPRESIAEASCVSLSASCKGERDGSLLPSLRLARGKSFLPRASSQSVSSCTGPHNPSGRKSPWNKCACELCAAAREQAKVHAITAREQTKYDASKNKSRVTKTLRPVQMAREKHGQSASRKQCACRSCLDASFLASATACIEKPHRVYGLKKGGTLVRGMAHRRLQNR